MGLLLAWCCQNKSMALLNPNELRRLVWICAHVLVRSPLPPRFWGCISLCCHFGSVSLRYVYPVSLQWGPPRFLFRCGWLKVLTVGTLACFAGAPLFDLAMPSLSFSVSWSVFLCPSFGESLCIIQPLFLSSLLLIVLLLFLVRSHGGGLTCQWEHPNRLTPIHGCRLHAFPLLHFLPWKLHRLHDSWTPFPA